MYSRPREVPIRRLALYFALSAASLAVLVTAAAKEPAAHREARPPNLIIILTDDQGYSDLGCYGSKGIKTPNIDRMAAEGMRFTQFYATAPICTPTRASLLTGRYPSRVGLGKPLHTTDRTGLGAEETTLAELLNAEGYSTACIGKWHLGHLPEFYPTRHGFDHYYGTPLGHCFTSRADRRDGQVSDLFLRGDKEVAFPPFESLTADLTEEAVRWMGEHKDSPFFLYLAHPMPHTPLAASERFRGKSGAGLFGDACEEIDWGVGEILRALEELDLDERTIVVFTSDNGAQAAEHNAPFRGRKQQPLEGGVRVPCVLRWPGHIAPGGTCDELATVMDFLPTFAKIAGAALPPGRVIDGKDIGALLSGDPNATTGYDAFIYHARFGKRAGIRMGDWKLLVDCDALTWKQEGIALYDLKADPGETKNLAKGNPAVVEKLQARLEVFERDLARERKASP